MTTPRPYKKYSSGLVLDGDTIKERLMAERSETKNLVHVDWLRFTVRVQELDFPSVDLLFPKRTTEPGSSLDALERMAAAPLTTSIWDRGNWAKRFLAELARTPDCDQHVGGIPSQARELAQEVVEILGPGFSCAAEIVKGQDYYAHRLSILHAEKECGWVGFGAKSDKQQAQAKTVHVNLFGSACTFGRPGWTLDMARLIERKKADITRIDLALDFFGGYEGGIPKVTADYMAGLCDVWGKRPSCNMVGDYINGHSRSFYVGSKATGKQTNVYEKGDQLYGHEANSDWIRFELRYGNKQRVIPVECLFRPDDFFAGASEWHSDVLNEAHTKFDQFEPEAIPTVQELEDETTEAAAYRVLKWALESAAPALSICFKYLPQQHLWSLVDTNRIPGRLEGFDPETFGPAFRRAAEKLISSAPVDMANPDMAPLLA